MANGIPNEALLDQRQPSGVGHDSATAGGTASSAGAAGAGGAVAEGHPPPPKALPKGVVLGKDGKPCRTCTSAASWRALTKKYTSSTSPPSSDTSTTSSTTSSSTSDTTAASTTSPQPPEDCPPDVSRLGNHSWTLLHSLSATYPRRATAAEQRDMTQFLALFAKLYPCWVCADDFRAWMAPGGGNEPRVGGRDEFGRWMCEAHNEVNRKLGKAEFDCARWEERWRTGWRDGRCD